VGYDAAVKRWWPSVRAALIAVAIVLGLADGFPSPEPRVNKQMDPTWLSVVNAVDAVRKQILKPFKPFSVLVRAHQKWNLFAGASKDRYRMWIEARTGPDAPWDVLYRVYDDEHDFLADQMAYRRMRGAWAPRGSRGPRGAYPAFACWVAREVFARWPDYVEVRIQMERVKVGPRGGATWTGEFTYPIARTRAQVLAEETKAAKPAAVEAPSGDGD
jgi:hypothetical protein